MPVSPTYPGVYIDELANPVRTIVGVPTAITAFVGPALRGPVDVPVRITSLGDFQRSFGGLWTKSLMSYAVTHYYQNGGSDAVIVRVANGATAAKFDLGNGVELEANSPGTWGNALRARVDNKTKDSTDATLYNLTVRDMATGAEESYRNVSTDPAKSTPLSKQLQTSRLLKPPPAAVDANRPVDHADVPSGDPFEVDDNGDPVTPNAFSKTDDGGGDGNDVTDAQITGGPQGETSKTGIYALLNTDIFNLLCLPQVTLGTDFTADTFSQAARLCVKRRAMLLVDPPAAWTDIQTVAAAAMPVTGNDAANAAIYFPRVRLADPLQGGQLSEFPPCGAVAGIYASTDARRGVWKAPAGIEAGLSGVRELTVPMTDPENGQLNPLGVNCLRSFRVIGPVVWGSRTLRGADALADQWKYVPIRRLALYIEESLYRGTQWAVFEPNDEPLWASLRLNIGAFMNTLYRQGAFAGRTPRDAYIVKCDKDNNPQNDIDRGIVNVLVGFAPLKPAEFVIIHIQQLAGQIQA